MCIRMKSKKGMISGPGKILSAIALCIHTKVQYFEGVRPLQAPEEVSKNKHERTTKSYEKRKNNI